MPVNFLPVPADLDDGGSFVSDLTDEAVDESVMDAEQDGSTALPGCGPEDRTVYWISQLPASNRDQSTSMADEDGRDQTGSDAPDQVDPDCYDENRLDSPDESISDKLDQSDPCGPAVNADCSVDLPDSHPSVSLALPVELLSPDVRSVTASEAGQNHSNDSLQRMRTRCGRVVRPVIRLIQNMHQKVVAGR